METVSNLAGAASKAIWGESKTTQEPLSGEQGDTSKGEPFDKGNLEEPTTTTDNTTSTPTTTSQGDADFAKTTGTAAESDKIPDNEQTNLKAKDTPADTSAGQNDTRDPSNPDTNPKNAATDVDDSGSGPNEPQKLEGSGPRPVAEVAAEHGGDAGNTGNAAAGGAEGGGKLGDGDESTDPNDPAAKSQGEGTGEKYVKSTGLAADGGDFDVTKPGAGREADRLMEEKGIHKDTDNKGPVDDSATTSKDTGSSSGGTGEKKKFTQRLKEKLHRS